MKSGEANVPKEPGCIQNQDCELVLKVSREENYFKWVISLHKRTADNTNALIEVTDSTAQFNLTLNAPVVYAPLKLFMGLNSTASKEPLCRLSIEGTYNFSHIEEKIIDNESNYTSCVFILKPQVEDIFHLDNDNLTIITTFANDTSGAVKSYFVKSFNENGGNVTLIVFNVDPKPKKSHVHEWSIIGVMVFTAYFIAILIILNPVYPKLCPKVLGRRRYTPDNIQDFENVNDERQHEVRRDVQHYDV